MRRSAICAIGLASGLVAANADDGVVVAEDTPGCDHFIVETVSGYTLLEWYGGAVSIFQGDTVHGDLNEYGFHDIYFDRRGTMRVWVDDYMASKSKAAEYFQEKCD